MKHIPGLTQCAERRNLLFPKYLPQSDVAAFEWQTSLSAMTCCYFAHTFLVVANPRSGGKNVAGLL